MLKINGVRNTPFLSNHVHYILYISLNPWTYFHYLYVKMLDVVCLVCISKSTFEVRYIKSCFYTVVNKKQVFPPNNTARSNYYTMNKRTPNSLFISSFAYLRLSWMNSITFTKKRDHVKALKKMLVWVGIWCDIPTFNEIVLHVEAKVDGLAGLVQSIRRTTVQWERIGYLSGLVDLWRVISNSYLSLCS